MFTQNRPPNNTFKLNVKGVFDRGSRSAAVGCALRDDDGSWVDGCGENIGLDVPVIAKLWSIFYGLKLAQETEKTNILIESECAEAITHIPHPDPSYHMALLIVMINNLLGEAWDHVGMSAIPPSANRVAQTLAYICISGDGGVDNIPVPPAPVTPIIAEEMQGGMCQCLVVVARYALCSSSI